MVLTLMEDDIRRRRVDEVVAVLCADGTVAAGHLLRFQRRRLDRVANGAAVAVCVVGLAWGGGGGGGGGG